MLPRLRQSHAFLLQGPARQYGSAPLLCPEHAHAHGSRDTAGRMCKIEPRLSRTATRRQAQSRGASRGQRRQHGGVTIFDIRPPATRCAFGQPEPRNRLTRRGCSPTSAVALSPPTARMRNVAKAVVRSGSAASRKQSSASCAVTEFGYRARAQFAGGQGRDNTHQGAARRRRLVGAWAGRLAFVLRGLA